MPETDLGNLDMSDLTNEMTDYSISSQTTDAPSGDSEYHYYNSEWPKYLGYYKTIPELKTAIDSKANWTIGAGYEADKKTMKLLDSITGNGKDSFNSILWNMITVKTINGDSFAEIIKKKNKIINIKPLAPNSIAIVQSGKGRIKRYEQVEKKKLIRTFGPDQILHLSRNRVADEAHGVSVIPTVEWIILARNEAMYDWKKVLHRNVQPLWIFHLDTDDTAKIAAFKAKMDAGRADGENLYIPKGAVVPEVVATATNASLNPLTWINQLNDYFFQAVNVPQIIIGNAKEFTDASGKIVYLAYEQSVKAEQLYIEEQIKGQLDLDIQLTFPASLQEDKVSNTPHEVDKVEEEKTRKAAEKNDKKLELEGKK